MPKEQTAMAVVKTINDTTTKAYERVNQRTHRNEQDTLTAMTMRITELHKHINIQTHRQTHTQREREKV